jgi:AAA family ATP:ADP antiporter
MSAFRERLQRLQTSFREHPLEAVLGLFADVRPGEGVSALLLTLTLFLLLLLYYLLKVTREPLILMGGGAEVKSYAAAGQAALLVVVSLVYGAIARRTDRVRLIGSVTMFFVTNLVFFAVLASRAVPIGVPFYLWVGVFNYTVVAQFWGFAADIYPQEQGKRLFPILGVGSSIGAVAGAGFAKKLIPLGPPALMLVAAVMLAACVGLVVVVHRREHDRPRAAAEPAHDDEKLGGANGFALLLKDRYLLLIGAFILIVNWVNTTGEYVLDRTLLDASRAEASPAQFIGHFKATFFEVVNIVGVVLQLFAVSRIHKYIGVRRSLFVMPVVSLMGYSAIAFLPVLAVVFAAKAAENALDYSLQNTTRQALWLPTSREAKYKAKQVVDAFLVRLGDVLSAGAVWCGVRIGLGVRGFAALNVGLVLVWFLVLLHLGRAYEERSKSES